MPIPSAPGAQYMVLQTNVKLQRMLSLRTPSETAVCSREALKLMILALVKSWIARHEVMVFVILSSTRLLPVERNQRKSLS